MIYECQHYGRVVGSVRSHPSTLSIQSIGTLSGAEIREYPAADGRMPAAYRQIVRSKNSYYREKRVRNCRTVAGDRADENSSPVESPLSVPVRFPSIYFPVLPLSVRHRSEVIPGSVRCLPAILYFVRSCQTVIVPSPGWPLVFLSPSFRFRKGGRPDPRCGEYLSDCTTSFCRPAFGRTSTS